MEESRSTSVRMSMATLKALRLLSAEMSLEAGAMPPRSDDERLTTLMESYRRLKTTGVPAQQARGAMAQ